MILKLLTSHGIGELVCSYDFFRSISLLSNRGVFLVFLHRFEKSGQSMTFTIPKSRHTETGRYSTRVSLISHDLRSMSIKIENLQKLEPSKETRPMIPQKTYWSQGCEAWALRRVWTEANIQKWNHRPLALVRLGLFQLCSTPWLKDKSIKAVCRLN